MRRLLEAISSAASIPAAVLLLTIVSAGVLAGCGSSAAGGSGPTGGVTATTKSLPSKPASKFPLDSVAIEGGKLPARYTCDGANISPPLKWGTIPGTSGEVVLFALGVKPGGASLASSSVEWVLAGLKPELHGVEAGERPPGSFLVENSNGKKQYSICPPKGQTRQYEFVAFAMPPLVTVGTRINGVKLLQNLAAGPPQDRAPGKGVLAVTYTRT
jgi:phosphatidylethanolamine-binding protein (PEBP) family uncharacterized protein